MSASRIDAVVARLHGLYPRLIDLSLDRLRDLLVKLGSPEQRLPPVIHVAGTNGKGSTCAFLRAIAEAAGLRVHVYTSPHLVRFNERIRLAGRLVDDRTLAEAMETVERVNAGAPITVFEVITAVAFHLFASVPADLCVLEVGLGGRGDATNVIDRPAACAITSISLDHRELLGDTLAAIAAEKAGIIKPGVPVAIGAQRTEAEAVLLAHAARIGAPARLRGREWSIAADGDGIRFTDPCGTLYLPPPSLLGSHQHDNAGIAIAALRATSLGLPDVGLSARPGIGRVAGPAATPGRGSGGAFAARMGGLAGWWPQPRRRRRAGGPAGHVARPPDASRDRHEAGQGHGRVPPAIDPPRRFGLGRGRTRTSTLALPVAAIIAAANGAIARRPARQGRAARDRPGQRLAGTRADLRQPLPRRRSAEARCG